MVALKLFHLRAVVFFFLADGDGLRSAGLAARQIAGTGKHPSRRALLRDADQRASDDCAVFGLVAKIDCWLCLQRPQFKRQRVLRADHQPRLVLDAVVGQHGGGLCQLQHGEGVVALADTERDGFTGIPLLLVDALVSFFLPVLAGQDAAHFAKNIDAGDLPEAHGFHEVVHGIDAQLIGQGVVVHIARLDDGLVHIDRTQAVVAVTSEGVAAKGVVRVVLDHRAGRALAGLQRCHRHEGLVGRARRVGAAQRAVQQRFVERFAQRGPAFAVDAIDEQVGIESGFADESQHLSGGRVHRNQRAAPVAKHVFDQLLQADIERQHDGVARRGGLRRELAHGATTGRGFDLLDTGDAMQLGLKALLDAELADVVGASVIAFVIAGFDNFLFALVDAADIADNVAAKLAMRVAAKQPRLDIDARKAKTLRRKACHFSVGQPRADWQRLEVFHLFAQALEALFVARRNIDHLLQRGDRFVDIGNTRRRDLQRVGRIIRRQHDAVAVKNESAIGDDRNDGGAVALCLLVQVLVAINLQISQTRGEHGESPQHDQAGNQHACAKSREIGFDVSKFGHGSVSALGEGGQSRDFRRSAAFGQGAAVGSSLILKPSRGR